jgi:hypothetical protein
MPVISVSTSERSRPQNEHFSIFFAIILFK